MKYGKIIDERLQIAGNEIKTDKGTVTNPNEELLKSLGYKEIVYTEKPEFDKENEALAEKYTEEENKIIVDYDIEVLSPSEHNVIIKQEIVEEEKKMTDRNIRGALLNNSYDINEITKIENKIVELRAKLLPEPKEEDNGGNEN